MTEHYYTRNPQTHSYEEKLEICLRGNKLQFITDRGVFSKERIDFGSKLLIDNIVIEDNAKILDVGCGYGPIGLTLAKEFEHRTVWLVDINQRAISLARKNAALNQISNIHIFESNLLELVTDRNFDHIVSNPPIRTGKDNVYLLFKQSHEHLRPGGCLWVVIQKKQGSVSAFNELETIFTNVEEITKKKGYRLIRARK